MKDTALYREFKNVFCVFINTHVEKKNLIVSFMISRHIEVGKKINKEAFV